MNCIRAPPSPHHLLPRVTGPKWSTTALPGVDRGCELVRRNDTSGARIMRAAPPGRFPTRGHRRLSCAGVTEIPEHLLKRSRERRAAASGDAAPAGAAAAA